MTDPSPAVDAPSPPVGSPRRRRPLLSLACLLVAAGVWLPTASWVLGPADDAYRTADGRPAPMALALADWQLHLWTDPACRAASIERMRWTNAEWDFMGRTFAVMAFANLAEHVPDRRDEWLAAIDTILDETLAIEREHGHLYFLMPYARDRPFIADPPRSVFVDGEIAMMLACRLLIEDDAGHRQRLVERTRLVAAAMRDAPIHNAESYPDEGWLFCNAVAAAALRLSDAVTGDDHTPLIADWLAATRQHLTDPQNGLLASRYTYDGEIIEGPEGTCLWVAAHCLQLIDPAFAEAQYAAARRELGRDLLGFGYAMEWPALERGHADVDSGPVVPVLDASAGSSGLALIGAAAFGDRAYLEQLLNGLHTAGFPVRDEAGLRFAASNQVGDSVILYSLVQGPLWRRVLAELGPVVDTSSDSALGALATPQGVTP